MCFIFSLNECDVNRVVNGKKQGVFSFVTDEEETKLYKPVHITMKTKMLFRREKCKTVTYHDIFVVCDGNIYNYKHLFQLLGEEPVTENPEIEIVAVLYEKFGMTHTLQLLHGVFSLILVDNGANNECLKIFVARDALGIKPLFVAKHSDNVVVFSNKKQNVLNYKSVANVGEVAVVEPVMAGTCTEFLLSSKVCSQWLINACEKWHVFPLLALNDVCFEKMCCNRLKQNTLNALRTTVHQMCIYHSEKKNIVCLIGKNDSSTDMFNLVNYFYNYNNNVCKVSLLRVEDDFQNDFEENVDLIFCDFGLNELCCFDNNQPENKSVLHDDCLIKMSLENIQHEMKEINEMFSLIGIDVCFPFLDAHFVNFYLGLHPILRKKHGCLL